MGKRVFIALSFLVGALVGLFLMFYLCDEFLGSRLSWSRTTVATSRYELKVEGGIITRARPFRVHVRATDLKVNLLFRGRERSPGESVVVEVDNLPRGFETNYQGPGFPSRGDGTFTVVVPLKKRAVVSRLSLYPSSVRVPFTFWVGGDNRERLDILLSLLREARKKDPLFIVLGGDLVLRGLWWQYDRLLEMLEDSPVPIFPVPGNHDLEFCGRRIFTRYLAPDHYSFSYGDSLFVVLDTNGKERGQLEWLDGLLRDPRYRHRFVFVHKPPLDPRPGRHHAMGDGEFARRLLDLLVKRRVDILFCSHIHSFLEAHYKGLKIVITGGLGARRKEPLKPFHYLRVEVGRKGVKVEMVPLNQGSSGSG